MELRHLRYFVAVAEALSFTKAAAKLRLAQPSLTRQIKNLETELRVELFVREKNRISLTEQGKFFLERTRRLLAQSALDVQDVRRRGPASGSSTLNIGYTTDLHYNLLPGALGALRKIWPDEPWSNETRFSRVDYRDVAEIAAIALMEDRLDAGKVQKDAGNDEQIAAIQPMFAWYDRHGLPGNAVILKALLAREPRTLRSYFEELRDKSDLKQPS
jgi:DNA-binding transcriptional LysR family regulator